MLSIKSEVLLGTYADIAGELSDLMKEKHIDEIDMSNVWVRLYEIIRREHKKILKVTTE